MPGFLDRKVSSVYSAFSRSRGRKVGSRVKVKVVTGGWYSTDFFRPPLILGVHHSKLIKGVYRNKHGHSELRRSYIRKTHLYTVEKSPSERLPIFITSRDKNWLFEHNLTQFFYKSKCKSRPCNTLKFNKILKKSS